MAETRKIMIDVEVNPSGASLGNVNKQLDETKTRVKNLKDETDKTSKSMGQGFTAGANAAALIPGPIGAAATSIGGLTGAVATLKLAFTTLKGALIATGIGAFVVVVGTLISYFTSTEAGAQKLRVIMATLGGVVSTVSNAMIGLLQGLKAIASGDILAGISKIGDSFSNLGSKAVTAAKQTNALENAMNKVLEAEDELGVKRSEANKEIANARMIADDLTKSTEERAQAIRDAGNVEEQVAQQEQAIAAERLRILEEQKKARGKASEEENDAIDAAKIRLNDLERETTMRQKRLGTELQSLKNEQEAKDKERDDARLAKIKEKNDAEIELAKKLAEEKKAAEEAAIKAAEKRIENQDKIDEYISERKAVTAEEELQLDIEQAQKAERLKYEAVVAAINENQADAQLRAEELAEAEDLYLRERMLVKGEIESEYYAKKLDEATKNADDIAAAEKAAAEKSLAATQKINASRISAATNVAGALGGIGRLMQQQGEENTAAAKTLAVAEIAINTAVAIAGAVKTATTGSPTAWDMIAGIAAGIAAVTAGIASATAILDTADVPGPSAAGIASGASAGATSAPSFSPVTTNTTQLGNTQQAELAPVQAYVVETQITGSQANINQIESQSTFGGG
jgi:chemotaxis protein histidine kinase CheA